MKRIKNLLKNKDGMSVTIQALIGVLVFALLLSCSIGVGVALHTINVLDRFADEMATVVSTQGKCEGDDIDKRFNELVAATGITPDITFETEYYDGIEKTVQYGDSITVHLKYDSKLLGWGDYYLPLPLKRKATRQSMQYWK